MITAELLQRINELAGKKKVEGLTPTELAEQKRLYKIYLASIREQVTTQLDEAGIKPKSKCGCHDANCKHHHH
ncbi:MAG TPA: DUF896 family protein [Syntrophomonas sp.]|jgi:uncharacterized protein YnzC (UPF0291/DUF896 family)|nr:DUF896 family protein [Syntrophomonas sp.]